MANTRGHRGNILNRLPSELLADIHGRLGLVDRFSFAAACGGASSRCLLLKPEPPCLVLTGAAPGAATLFSLADRRDDAARALDPAMRGHHVVVLGSSGGWLVTANARGQLRMANPVTGDQADLPAITTIPFVRWKGSTGSFLVDTDPFLQMRRRSSGSPPIQRKATASSFSADQFRSMFYRKAVLSASPRSGSRSYAAMLILDRQYGAPAFATAEDPAWRLAPFRDAVEDAIYHNGRFYSITYSGEVESWTRHGDTGEFTGETVAPGLACQDHNQQRRKYLAAAPDGRLMAVHKHSRSCVFRVQVLDEERGQWEETKDIGNAALFVGVNSSMCVPTEQHPGLVAGCVYFTNDQLGEAHMDWGLLQRYGSTNSGYGMELRDRDVGVFNLRDGKVGKVEGLGLHPFWPLPAWFTPLIS